MHLAQPVLDAHVHYLLDLEPASFVALLDRTGTEKANLTVIQHGGRLNCTPEALALKALYPERFTVFGQLDPCLYYRGGADMGAKQASYAAGLLAAGCDGIKLLEGKPQLRKALPIPDFDAPCWDAFWAWCEKEAVPILWHVNDPENFWDASKVPAWAAKQGWLYDDSFVNNEEQYRQVLTVLSRHPGLRICFAHFFFLSAQLERLAGILETYPNVVTDLTPGIEMFENFSKTPARTRAFFERFHDRILYGTDIGSRFVYSAGGRPFNEKENLRRPQIVRAFLTNTAPETVSADGDFVIGRPDFEMMGLGLSGERLREVLGANFLRFAGENAHPVDPERVRELIGDTRRKLRAAAKLPSFHPDGSGLDAAERIFNHF